MRRLLTTGVVACLALVGGFEGAGRAATDPTPVLAYYYIWFDATSWNRAKRDYPLLGRYSSDERRRHAAARPLGEAGGHRRLHRQLEEHAGASTADCELLLDVAAEEHFKLVLIYQGLDFERDPLPAERIADRPRPVRRPLRVA